MTAAQYRAALDKLGMTQTACAEFLRISDRTARRWASGETAVEESAAKLLRLMVKLGLKPADVP